MLQRAASNAYSWWWASHIRTKQSKWLEQNLLDMEDKVGEMLKIIDDSGDSFAQRAEMYYRKRPELINFVEDSYRAYRALAERYDHLSKELQSANRTIATVFPEQVQFAMEAEDEEHQRELSAASNKLPKFSVPKSGIPKVPDAPKKDFRSKTMLACSARKGQGPLKRTASSAKNVLVPTSGLGKNEALEEIDKLQKGILSLQTEKEFVKCSYEHGYEKYWEIENQITEMQAKVCSLQDEFGIGTVIDDNEARSLMASTAIKSCQQAIAKLQEKQEQAAGETKQEYERILDAHEKFKTLRNQFRFNQTDDQSQGSESESVGKLKDLGPQISDMELLNENIKNLSIDPHAGLSMTRFAEKVDELVSKVVHLETAVSSQTALVKRLRSETDDLHGHINSLEEEKEALKEDSIRMRKKIKELEEELLRVRSLNQSLEDQNNNLQTHLTEANTNIEILNEKLQSVEMEEEDDNARLFPKKEDKEEKENEGKGEGEPTEKLEAQQEGKEGKKFLSEIASSILHDLENDIAMEEGEEPSNWRQIAIEGLDDREKLLLEEYTIILRNYKDVKRKLSDVEKKNRDGFIELALQIRALENAVAFRDQEIQSLRNKMMDGSVTESHAEGTQESIMVSSMASQRGLDSFSEQDFKEAELKTPRHAKGPTVEEKIRTDIDELLEDNLEFWLRFSTTFHQIQKYQTTVQDLKAELFKLMNRLKREGGDRGLSALNSEARPIYKHLREIQTELTLWLENNAVLKDELNDRYSALCNIQEEVSKFSSGGARTKETALSDYQAAKFQGEVLNMIQENKRIANELHAGLETVKQLRVEVERTLAKLDEELGKEPPMRRAPSRARIPLHSFLFGVKLKKKAANKPSLFSCMNPSLQRNFSTLPALPDK